MLCFVSPDASSIKAAISMGMMESECAGLIFSFSKAALPLSIRFSSRCWAFSRLYSLFYSNVATSLFTMASHNPRYPSIAPDVEEEEEDLFSRLEEEEGQQEQQPTHLWQQPDLLQPPQ